jgi:hypothetical protein
MQRVKIKVDVKKFIKVILENKSDFLLSDPEELKGREITQIRDLGILLRRLIKD